MSDWQSFPAPAKLNLFLHITGRLANGYHTLQTIFQFIDLQDTLEIRPRDDGALNLDAPGFDCAAEDNLITRAAQALRQASGKASMGADIRLVKRIPAGGGLGGGSSDAATTLLALNRLWRVDWSPTRLAELGARLGADVPVFIHGQAAWAEGVGDQLTPLLDLPRPWYLVVHPGCRVPTRDMYLHPALTRNTQSVTIADFLAGRCRNDFEPVAMKSFPPVEAALQRLSVLAPTQMTGSGACIFARFEREADATKASRTLPEAWSAWVVRGLNESPARTLAVPHESAP